MGDPATANALAGDREFKVWVRSSTAPPLPGTSINEQLAAEQLAHAS